MAIDGIFLHFMQCEIADWAVGAKVDKIFMPAKYELVFVLRTRTESRRLFISVGGNSPRLNFTSSNPENPQNPPMICMLFRKLLTGAVIRGIRQHGLDRVLFIDFDASNEIGERTTYTLVVEIMGQYSNCILLNADGVIVDALRRVDLSKSSFREILPQISYRLPPQQDKINILTDTPELACERILSKDGVLLSAAFLSCVSGVSPLTAREIAYRVVLGDCAVGTLTPMQQDRLLFELKQLSSMIRTGKCSPCYLRGVNGEYLDFSFMPLTFYSNAAQIIPVGSLSEILDLFYVEREKLIRAKAKAEDLYRTVNGLIERTAKKINNQRAELLSADALEEKRRFAELINANIYALKKGFDTYEVADYYHDNRPVRIPVSSMLSPAANAQKYYKEYRKAQTALQVLSQQIKKGEEDLAYLKTVQDALCRAETQGELGEIRAELSQTGFLRSKTGTKNKKNSNLPPYTFSAPGGHVVFVGRNNLQNDMLTFKKAAKSDVWFHVKQAPGSHVILSLNGDTATDGEMQFAAQTAAWFSSVRNSGMAEVDYTLVKNIKKPPGSKPGYVIYHVYNTAYVKTEKPE